MDLAYHRLRGQDVELCCFGLFQEPGRWLVLALCWSWGHPLPGGIYREQSSPPGSSQCDLLAAEDSKIFWGKDLLQMCRIQNWDSGTGLLGTLSQGGVSLRDCVAQSSWMCLDCTGERCIPERSGSSGVLRGFEEAQRSVQRVWALWIAWRFVLMGLGHLWVLGGLEYAGGEGDPE